MNVSWTPHKLDTLDLNLLRVLEALLEELNVGRAAARLGRSQPAVSNALARLRRALGDPLFVRTREGIAPTARARSLAGPLSQALAGLRAALEAPAAFDPRTARRTFVLAASDHAQLLVVPGLAARLARWPGLKLRLVPLPQQFPARELERGELDLVLGVFDLAPGDRAPSGLRSQVLCREQLAAVGRKGHPALKRNVLEAMRLPQLNVSPRGGTATVTRRFGRGDRRNIVLFVPHYAAAPWVLSTTELLAVLPYSVARRFCGAFPLQAVLLHGVPSHMRVQQLWHPRAHHDDAHRWLRAEVHAAAAPFDAR